MSQVAQDRLGRAYASIEGCIPDLPLPLAQKARRLIDCSNAIALETHLVEMLEATLIYVGLTRALLVVATVSDESCLESVTSSLGTLRDALRKGTPSMGDYARLAKSAMRSLDRSAGLVDKQLTSEKRRRAKRMEERLPAPLSEVPGHPLGLNHLCERSVAWESQVELAKLMNTAGRLSDAETKKYLTGKHEGSFDLWVAYRNKLAHQPSQTESAAAVRLSWLTSLLADYLASRPFAEESIVSSEKTLAGPRLRALRGLQGDLLDASKVEVLPGQLVWRWRRQRIDLHGFMKQWRSDDEQIRVGFLEGRGHYGIRYLDWAFAETDAAPGLEIDWASLGVPPSESPPSSEASQLLALAKSGFLTQVNELSLRDIMDSLEVGPALADPTRFEIDDYIVEFELGHGATSIVYKARHASTDVPAVIKLLAEGLTTDPDSHRLFRREAKALAKVRHRNVVSVVDATGEWRSKPYLVLDYVHGPTLADVRDRINTALSERRVTAVPDVIADVIHEWQVAPFVGSGRTDAPSYAADAEVFSYATIAELFAGAAMGLVEIHRQNMIHCDIKPSNLILDCGHPNRLVIVDFGVAKLVDASTFQGKTGGVVGTPQYWAPEQRRYKPRANKPFPTTIQTDIFAFGAVLYEVLTGTRYVYDEESASVEWIQLATPTDLKRIVEKALSRSTVQRYHSAAELANDLQRAAERSIGWRNTFELVKPRTQSSWMFGLAALALGVGLGIGRLASCGGGDVGSDDGETATVVIAAQDDDDNDESSMTQLLDLPADQHDDDVGGPVPELERPREPRPTRRAAERDVCFVMPESTGTCTLELETVGHAATQVSPPIRGRGSWTVRLGPSSKVRYNCDDGRKTGSFKLEHSSSGNELRVTINPAARVIRTRNRTGTC